MFIKNLETFAVFTSNLRRKLSETKVDYILISFEYTAEYP